MTHATVLTHTTHMKRPYQEPANKQVDYFLGKEVEHSPLLGRSTLFVVGPKPSQEILALAESSKVEQIYLGANQSFDGQQLDAWIDTIDGVVKNATCWVAFDFDVRWAEWVAECGWCESNRFVPMISVKIPYIGLFNYNTTVKIDDKGFDASNPGVWCHRLHQLMDPKVYTDWTAYTKDQTL